MAGLLGRRLAHVRRLGAIATLILAGCGRPQLLPLPAGTPEPEPGPDQVESVIFFLGDPGNVMSERSPILTHLGQEVERWAGELAADSAIAVLVLGDIVYPDGVRNPGSPEYDRDTAIVRSQARLVSGPAAREGRARMYFMAGNHDWGLRRHWNDLVRLRNLDDILSDVRDEDEAPVRLVPEVGTGGPYVTDWGAHLRLIILDTAWWLISAEEGEKQGVLDAIEEAMATAGGREVIIAAHHPFRSGGPHGGGFSFWSTLGLRYLLHRAGVIQQDMTSPPYRELREGLSEIFARQGAPLAFVGGHEHSLQVIVGVEPNDPSFNLVSGSGSKLTGIGPEPGLVFGRSWPGYMKLVVQADGRMTLFVEATDPAYIACPLAGAALDLCMREGLAGLTTIFSQRLR